MRIRTGFKITYECPAPTPMLLNLSIHPSRRADLEAPETLASDPPVAVSQYRDSFGNLCSRIVAPAGRTVLRSQAVIRDGGRPDPVAADAPQAAVQDLPDETLIFLLGSRYCETDRLSDLAWSLFGDTPAGWPRVQAICDWVHGHIRFDYLKARPTKGAWDAHGEAEGVCRDFAHLAITFCRAMNIPARYCTGYLGDIGVAAGGPMDFAAWFEAYLGGRWHTFDPRNHTPRIGRILMARGRDATDVALVNSFGPALLCGFEVTAEQVAGDAAGSVAA